MKIDLSELPPLKDGDAINFRYSPAGDVCGTLTHVVVADTIYAVGDGGELYAMNEDPIFEILATLQYVKGLSALQDHPGAQRALGDAIKLAWSYIKEEPHAVSTEPEEPEASTAEERNTMDSPQDTQNAGPGPEASCCPEDQREEVTAYCLGCDAEVELRPLTEEESATAPVTGVCVQCGTFMYEPPRNVAPYPPGYPHKDMDQRLLQMNKEGIVGAMGWICPVCGRGVSPYVEICDCKMPDTITVGAFQSEVSIIGHSETTDGGT